MRGQTSRVRGVPDSGLAISSTLVERMGSKLFLESVVDEGSTFSFLLPKA